MAHQHALGSPRARGVAGRAHRAAIGDSLDSCSLAPATAAGVLLLDVLYGVPVAIGLSILDPLRRLARPHDGILGEVTRSRKPVSSSG